MGRRGFDVQSTASLKLIALALALVLELYFYSQDNSINRRISAVIEIQNVPDNRLIVEPSYALDGIPAHIDVYGPRNVVDQLSMTLHKVRVLFPPNAESSFPLDVNYENLSLPPRVSIVSAKPARLNLRTVELVRKEVEIYLPTVGSVKEGYKLDKIKLIPERVIVKGPLQEVQKIKKIELDSLDITDLDDYQRLEVRLESTAENTSTNVNLVGVELFISKIEEKLEEKSEEPVTLDKKKTLKTKN